MLVEAVSDSALARKRQGAILAVGDTNAAADNLLEGLLERGINVVRWGGGGPWGRLGGSLGWKQTRSYGMQNCAHVLSMLVVQHHALYAEPWTHASGKSGRLKPWPDVPRHTHPASH